jgi:radical SAM superfamily enzyme YgiQ (UPF0313 family)
MPTKIEKIYLLNPPSYNQIDRLVREGRCMQRESSWSNLWMPLTLCILKPWLEENLEVKCKLRDAVADRMSMEDIAKEINSFNPDVTIINTAVPSLIKEDLDTAKLVKKIKPDTIVIMIGVPATVMTDIIYNDPRGKYIDFCVHHEPELSLLNLLKKIKNGKEWKRSKGIAFKRNKKIVYNKSYPPMNLDKLPEADFTELPLKEYTLPFSRESIFMVETSRGCPFNCSFCVGKLYYSNCFRYRNPKKIVDEIENINSTFGVRNFLFWADNWMLGMKKAEKTCDEIIKRKLDINFLANGRVDSSPIWLLKKMKKAGCRLLAYGVESCVQEILDNVKKGISVKQIETAFNNSNKVGLTNAAHIIIGLPGENWKTVNITLNRLIKFNPTFINVYSPVPYPGTLLFEQAKKNKWIKTYDWSMYEELNTVMRNEAMTTEEITKARKYIVKKFYLRPSIISREIKNSITKDKPMKRLYFFTYDSLRFMKSWIFDGKFA